MRFVSWRVFTLPVGAATGTAASLRLSQPSTTNYTRFPLVITGKYLRQNYYLLRGIFSIAWGACPLLFSVSADQPDAVFIVANVEMLPIPVLPIPNSHRIQSSHWKLELVMATLPHWQHLKMLRRLT
jgi:hypothetical protein